MADIRVHHTHLYPGARGTIAGALGDGPVQVEFSDGNVVIARFEDETLSLPGYRTAAGTRIEPRRWRLAIMEDHFRVTARDTDRRRSPLGKA